MKQQNKIPWLIIAASLSMLYSCTFQIASPKPSDPAENTSGPPVNADGHLVITLKFTDPVDINSVVFDKTFFLDFSKKPGAHASFNWSADAKTLTITTDDQRSDLVSLLPDGGFTVRLIGTDKGNGTVKSTNGVILDGDYDGKPGGDYIKVYRIIG
jgi:hypothetical protein